MHYLYIKCVTVVNVVQYMVERIHQNYALQVTECLLYLQSMFLLVYVQCFDMAEDQELHVVAG